MAQLVKNPPAMWETWVQSLGGEDPLEKGKATYSSVLTWKSPWTVLSMGLQRVGAFLMDPPAMQKTQETQVQSLGPEDPLEEEMAAHSSILA